MAIHPKRQGIRVSILSNGSPLEEIDDEEFAEQLEANASEKEKYWHENTISKYICIPSSSDTQGNITSGQFSIQLMVGRPLILKTTPKLGFHIFVDGNQVWESVCRKPDYVKLLAQNRPWEDIVAGVKQGKGAGCKLLPFKFASINTTDESPDSMTMSQLASKVQKVGVIEIRVYRQSAGKLGGDTMGDSGQFAVESVIPEKVLKGDAKSHLTQLGKPEKVARGPVYKNMKNLDQNGYPLVVFRFMYRSEKALRQTLIIKSSDSQDQSSTPDPDDDSEEDIDPEEEKKMFEQWREEKKRKAKEEKLDKAKAKRVKKEKLTAASEAPSMAKRIATLPGGNGTIDLTGDDCDSDSQDSSLECARNRKA